MGVDRPWHMLDFLGGYSNFGTIDAKSESLSLPTVSKKWWIPPKKTSKKTTQRATKHQKKKQPPLFFLHQMGVSKNSGTPKSSILIGFSIINHPFWGTPIFGNTQTEKSTP